MLAAYSTPNRTYYISFGIENFCTVYSYSSDYHVLEKVAIEDLSSDITCLEVEEENDLIYVSVETREVYILDPRQKFKAKQLSSTPILALAMQASANHLVFLLENRNIYIRELESKKKLESSMSKIVDLTLIKHLNLLVALNFKQEIFVLDLEQNKLLITVQLPRHINHILCSHYRPYILVFGDFGFVDIYLALTGDLINRIGPFNNIQRIFYDERSGTLCVMEKDLRVQVFKIKVKMEQLEQTKDSDLNFEFLSPNIFHSFYSKENYWVESKKKYKKVIDILIDLINKFQHNQDAGILRKLEKISESIKKEIDICSNSNLRLLLLKVCELKYQNGIGEVDYNIFFEDFSFCQSTKDKFDIIISCFALSKDKRFFAVGYYPSLVKIFLTAERRVIYTLSDVNFIFKRIKDQNFLP